MNNIEILELYNMGMSIKKNQDITDKLRQLVESNGFSKCKKAGLPALVNAFYKDSLSLEETEETFEDLVDKYNINTIERKFWDAQFNSTTSWFNTEFI